MIETTSKTSGLVLAFGSGEAAEFCGEADWLSMRDTAKADHIVMTDRFRVRLRCAIDHLKRLLFDHYGGYDEEMKGMPIDLESSLLQTADVAMEVLLERGVYG